MLQLRTQSRKSKKQQKTNPKQKALTHSRSDKKMTLSELTAKCLCCAENEIGTIYCIQPT